jgi:MFS family permease
MAPAVIADIFFLHDRGKYNTGYFVVYFGSLMVGPIVAGPMAEAVGWRNFWWLNVGMFILSTITIIFGFPETKWHRPHASELHSIAAGAAGAGAAQSDASSAEKVNTGMGLDDIAADHRDTTGALAHDEGLTHTNTAEQDPFLGRGTPAKWQFRLWQPMDHHTNILREITTPWLLLLFPIVEFSSFVVSWSASCFLTVNLTQAQNFAYPPYNYSTTVIGFFNFAPLVGTIIGLATAGPLSDWVSAYLTKRNGGIREPEMRLPALIPYVLIMIVSNFINAYGYQNSWDWRIIVLIGYALSGIQVAAIPGIASTYAIDSYKPVAGAVFVSITINKNVWGYGFSKFITEWIVQSG